MRRKKHKTTRRTVRFYKINFGFRPPYKILLDGNFVNAVESLKRGDCNELIVKLLGDPARVFTTKCVMHELRSLGKDFADTKHICKKFALHKCDHDDGTSATDCLASQIDQGNPEHFFVATQDKTLQRKVMASPGGAVIFASVNGIHLETPSAMQKAHVHLKEERHMAPGKVEARSKSLKELAEAEIQEKTAHSGPKIIRKKAKGPNPLSMKPKQKKTKHVDGSGTIQQQNNNAEKQQKQAGEGEEDGAKRKRKRRRREGGNNIEAAAGPSSD